MTMTSRITGLLASSVILFSVFGCSTGDESSEPSEPHTATSNSPEEETKSSASDDGAVQIEKEAYSRVSSDSEVPGAVYAVEISNTSQADLVVMGELELEWLGADGESESETSREILNLPPGKTMTIGRVAYLDFEATELHATLTSPEWYSFDDYQSLGLDPEIQIHDTEISADNDLAAKVEYTTNDPETNTLTAFLIMRDESGKLLGGSESLDVIREAAGKHTTDIGFTKDEWLDEADPNESEVVFVRER